MSAGLYASLNCGPGSDDDRACIIENRRRACAALAAPESRLVTLHQVHGANTIIVGEPWDMGQGPKADAMATNAGGIVLGILTADCAPILLADADARVVGAAHAGWKGAVAGIVELAIGAMESLGARRARMAAAIGPCISQSAYEVGEELRARVLADTGANARFFALADRAGHWLFDLPAYARALLDRAGVHDISDLAVCTYAHEFAFYSFRRATHRHESDYGRQLSAISLV